MPTLSEANETARAAIVASRTVAATVIRPMTQGGLTFGPRAYAYGYGGPTIQLTPAQAAAFTASGHVTVP